MSKKFTGNSGVRTVIELMHSRLAGMEDTMSDLDVADVEELKTLLNGGAEENPPEEGGDEEIETGPFASTFNLGIRQFDFYSPSRGADDMLHIPLYDNGYISKMRMFLHGPRLIITMNDTGEEISRVYGEVPMHYHCELPDAGLVSDDYVYTDVVNMNVMEDPQIRAYIMNNRESVIPVNIHLWVEYDGVRYTDVLTVKIPPMVTSLSVSGGFRFTTISFEPIKLDGSEIPAEYTLYVVDAEDSSLANAKYLDAINMDGETETVINTNGYYYENGLYGFMVAHAIEEDKHDGALFMPNRMPIGTNLIALSGDEDM